MKLLIAVLILQMPFLAFADDDNYDQVQMYHDQQVQLQRQNEQFNPPDWLTGHDVYDTNKQLERTYDNGRQEASEIRQNEREDGAQPLPIN